MLRLENIKKVYLTGPNQVDALKGVTISFRKNEFVSILGPSGCGKTTMLNIIGGLDKYSEGDLFINGKSTKYFSDRDWDKYRNHRIGFIFQSYNLIPHQTILGNVELALTIAGISKKERTERAMNVLDQVGLKGMYKKMPNQLSGGQCQRVAIARALVNDPEILLADEPTGALDTQTSKQIMDLIKRISQDKLVIMVTHNPELATEYSSRIVNLLDGNIINDTNPFDRDDEIKECEELNKSHDNSKEQAKMSIVTATRLSAQNLYSKRKRTGLVAFAGSIGIIGVSMVLAISAGIKNYIKNMQDDLLSGYPITIRQSSYDIASLMDSANKKEALERLDVIHGHVNVNSVIEYLLEREDTISTAIIENNITQDYIDYIKSMPTEYYSDILFSYGIDPTNNIYTSFSYDGIESQNRSLSSILTNYKKVLEEEEEYASLSGYISMFSSPLAQAPSNKEYILSQYDLLEGDIATKKDELMIVVSNDTELTDVSLAQLGYYSQSEFLNIAYRSYKDKNDKASDRYNPDLDKMRFSYQELMNKRYVYYPNNDVYTKNETATASYNPFTYNYLESDTWTDGLELKVVGILRPKETISYGCLNSGFYYTKEFTEYFIEKGLNSEIVTTAKAQNKDAYISPFPNAITYNMEFKDASGASHTTDCYVGTLSNAFASIIGSFMGGGSGTGTQINDIYQLSVRNLGGNDIANEISIYPVNFNLKDKVTDYLDNWNNDADVTFNTSDGTTKTLSRSDRDEIKYNDTIGIIISLVNTMINAISYALIAFTALSLVVSTVMIGIITYVSVVERIKEIGVIRSLGGRKMDVSNLFIAETVMIGLFSGILGILITYLLSLIVNLILNPIIGFNIATLPISNAFIMIAVSIVLTLISGLFPATSAARKDPVVALRTE